MLTTNRTHLHVVPVHFDGDERIPADADAVPAYLAAGLFDLLGTPSVSEPTFPESLRTEVTTTNIGLLGGEIADAVADGLQAGSPVLVAGGNCTLVPGVVGGIQQALGPDVRLGLVWFDAHGDFNTPRTTPSGMLGGMPVAVAAGLAHAEWRTLSHQRAPLPTDRILMVDVRNLDPDEDQLVRATDVVVAAPAAGYPGVDLAEAAAALADRCDVIYLHVDADILDERYVPNHRTKEPNGPTMAETLAAVDTVMATGKVAVFALVSVWRDGEGGSVAIASGQELLRGSLVAWERHGNPLLAG